MSGVVNGLESSIPSSLCMLLNLYGASCDENELNVFDPNILIILEFQKLIYCSPKNQLLNGFTNLNLKCTLRNNLLETNAYSVKARK